MRSMWAVLGLALAVVMVALGVLIVVIGSSSTAVGDLQLGDCFDFPAIGDAEQSVQVLEQVDVIGCEEPHEAEVVLVGDLNSAVVISTTPTTATCSSSSISDAASPHRSSFPNFGVLPIAPSEDSWTRLEGRFQCLAVPYGGGRTIGTLAVSGSSD